VKNFILGMFFILFAAFTIVVGIYFRDIYRAGEVRKAMVYIERYNEDQKFYPLYTDFLDEFPHWADCKNFCYESDSDAYTITYKLNNVVRLPSAPGEPQIDSVGNLTGVYIVEKP
jgi:hypothetical protein